MELWLRAGELGCACAEAYFCLGGTYYRRGQGVERDIEEAKHYYELTAMEGNIFARHNIGVLENKAGNLDRAMKHLMMSVAAGCDNSVKEIRVCFMNGRGDER
jgi:localization factor PodJL